ncbi:Methyltransferase-like protein 13 [Armadillidium vulgare]|nr:Methyltransferase-like protein 13 [Armadillidium vulgare]
MFEHLEPNAPNDNSKYKDIDYWNFRYSKEESYEWCKSYIEFKHLMKDHIQKTDRILILGCGNSNLSEDLYKDGYENITNIDFSSVAIETASKKTQSKKMLLLFVPESFDVILEKATLDALLVDEKDPWRLSKDADALLKSILLQISTLLTDGGKFISLTFAQPHFRKKIMCHRRYNWSYKYFTYGSSFHYFFYVMTKGESFLCSSSEEEEEESEKENGHKRHNLSFCTSGESDNIEYLNKISDELFQV